MNLGCKKEIIKGIIDTQKGIDNIRKEYKFQKNLTIKKNLIA